MANLYFEDVEVGDCCMAGPYLVTKSEIVQFAKQYAQLGHRSLVVWDIRER